MKKKILFRIHSLEADGVAKVMLDILKHLDTEKFESYILLDTFQGDILETLPENIRVFSLANGKHPMSPVKLVSLFQKTTRGLQLRLYHWFPKLLKNKIGIVPDIEIAMMHSSLPAMTRSPFKKSRKLNWFHSDLRFTAQYSGKRIAKMMNSCDMTVFVSYSARAEFVNHFKIEINKSICIYNAFNESEIKEKSLEKIPDREQMILNRENLFVSVGELTCQKGYDVLIDAHIELIKEGIDHTVVIIGEGPDDQLLQDKIKQYGIESSFYLLGTKKNPYPYISAADFYIQPSRYEAFPQAVGEAMVLGKPVISTDVGGVRELITHKRTGYLISFDKENLKSALKTFVLNSYQTTTMIKKELKTHDFALHNENVYKNINNVLLSKNYEKRARLQKNLYRYDTV